MGLSPKGCYFANYFYCRDIVASLGIIRPFEIFGRSYKYKRGSFDLSSSLGFGIYLSKDFRHAIYGMIWVIKCILMRGIFSLSLLELLFGKFMDGYTLFVM